MSAVAVFSVESQCMGKNPYRYKRDAKLAVKRIACQGGGGHSPRLMQAYRCPHCDRWHVGHHPPRSNPMSMPTDPQALYEGQLTTSETSVYTAPAGRVVTIASVDLVNTTSSAATARIDRVPAGSSDGTTKEVFNGSVAANSTVTLPTGLGNEELCVLEAGDRLYVSAGTASAIDITINGIERQP
jgi:hypothetical protein